MVRSAYLHQPLRVDRCGVVALEFALIAPAMSIFLVGLIELTNIIRVQAKLNVAAGQFAELIAGQPAVIIGATSGTATTAQSLSDMCAGAAMNMLPYNTGALQASVDSITVANTFLYVHPVTDWTTDVSCGATSYHAGQALFNYANSPRSLYTTDGAPYGSGGTPVMGYSGIVVQMRYQYANVLPRFMGTSIILTAIAVARPRSNARITCTTNANTSTPITCPANP